MKRALALGALVALITLAGCKEKCDADYQDTLVVKNDTDKTIVVEGNLDYNYGYYACESSVTIAPGKSETIYYWRNLGPCDSTTPRMRMDDDSVVPWGLSKENAESFGLELLDMEVGDKEISDKIWLARHWTFEGDNYDATYTLTVTDEFLAELEAAQ